MVFTIDTYTLNVTSFSFTVEPIGVEWISWENEAIVRKRFIYGAKRVWRLRCIENNVAWSSSIAKYLQDKMTQGETVTLTIDEGERYSLPATVCHIASMDMEIETARNIRWFTVVLRER